MSIIEIGNENNILGLLSQSIEIADNNKQFNENSYSKIDYLDLLSKKELEVLKAEILDIKTRECVIKLLKKTKIKSFKEFKNSLQHISRILDKWNWELDSITTDYEKCHICQKFLGYHYYDWDNFVEVNLLYYCKRCDETYCKKCGNIHKKRHIDERRLEMYEAKKIYRRNKIINKTNKYHNQKSKQMQLTYIKKLNKEA